MRRVHKSTERATGPRHAGEIAGRRAYRFLTQPSAALAIQRSGAQSPLHGGACRRRSPRLRPVCRELAEIIHRDEGTFANYTFETWRQLKQLACHRKQPHEDWIRSVNFDIQVRASFACRLRSIAQTDLR